jgi:hypothetical protein
LHSLSGHAGEANSTEKIIEMATEYYKELFKHEDRPDISFSSDIFFEGDKVTMEKNLGLERELSEEEIKKTVFEAYSDGAPSPDGLSFTSYQKTWDAVKGDLLEMFKDFHQGKLDMYKLNFALIIVIPKEKDARTMNKFRPISLLNCSYKIFTKVLTNRIGSVADRLVASNQTIFIKGRYILESVVTAHETIHDVHQSRQQRFVLKLEKSSGQYFGLIVMSN